MDQNQLFDYFVVVGLVALPPSPLQDDDDMTTTYMPQVIDRYPLLEATDRCGYSIPPTLPFFAMPQGSVSRLYLRLDTCRHRKSPIGAVKSTEGAASDKSRCQDRFFTFVLTDGAGASYYGADFEIIKLLQ
jgi:hypothetical protein